MNVAAAYSLDVIDDDTLFDCEGFETIAGQMIRCGAYPGTHGVQTPADVLKNSCNAGMMQIGQKMGAAEFLRYQDIFGFGSLTGIDLPGEAYGLVHTEDTMGPTRACNEYIRTGLHRDDGTAGSCVFLPDQRRQLLPAACDEDDHGQHRSRC